MQNRVVLHVVGLLGQAYHGPCESYENEKQGHIDDDDADNGGEGVLQEAFHTVSVFVSDLIYIWQI